MKTVPPELTVSAAIVHSSLPRQHHWALRRRAVWRIFAQSRVPWRVAACTFVRGLAIAFWRYRSRPIASRGATWLLALGTLFVCLLPTARASEAFLWFHYYPYPDCTRGTNGDIGRGCWNVHVGAPPAQYTYYAFDIYYNGIYTGQITWQVDAAGVVWNPNGTHVADFTVRGSPPPPDPGLWTFINPQSSDPTEIAGMLAVPLTVTYESDCLGLVGSMIPMPIDVYTGRATPTPTPSPTPGTNLTDKDKKVGGNQCDEKPRDGAVQRPFDAGQPEHRGSPAALHATAWSRDGFCRHLQSKGDPTTRRVFLQQSRPEVDFQLALVCERRSDRAVAPDVRLRPKRRRGNLFLRSRFPILSATPTKSRHSRQDRVGDL